MTHVATMGTHSCATVSIGSFKGDNFQRNQAYLEDKSTGTVVGGETAQQFYSNVLYPTSQPLGKSGDYPFDMLMDAIDGGSLNSKFIIATLNQHQMNFENGYWPARLEERGFAQIDKTKNDIGQVCTVFTRNNNRVD